MSTIPQPQPAAPPPAPSSSSDEVRVISHSNIFYWWPVWAVGFIMGIWTFWIDGGYMVTVPPGSKAVIAEEVRYHDSKDNTVVTAKNREIIMAEDGKKLPRETSTSADPEQPRLHMARGKALGVLFCTTLLLVITITNVPLRGMWSVVVIITVVLLAVIVALAGWWEAIVTKLSLLDIRINAGGYFFISGILFTIWAIATFFFDRQTYIVFTPGQFKVCQSVGEGERVYDTMGLSLERQRGDLFRHYILGLGSGDLVVKTTGAQAHHFDLPNVLWIGRKVSQIEELLRKRKVETK
jgi:hypothetical protein